MAKERSTLVGSDPVAAGWAALKQARWDDARAEFERALRLEETAEAMEGLSWAAWWLDDADAVFAARERAYALYRKRGDAGQAAQIATWLAVDHLDFRGAVAVTSGWLGRAHRLLDGMEPCAAHGWLAFQEGYLAHAAGDTGTAIGHGARALELGRRFGVVDLEMLGLALQGASLVGSARVTEGTRCLDEATAAALEGDAAIPIATGWTFCLLVSSCVAAFDFARAAEWCDRIAEFADRYGSRYMLAFCRAEYGAVQLWRGRWADAEALLEASVEDFSRSRPAWTEGPLVELAELRRRQGRKAEAARLLDEAGGTSRSHLCRARLALDAGETARAVDLLERLLRQLPADRGLDRAPALGLLAHARVARGELERASDLIAELRALERRVGPGLLTAFTDVAEAALASAGGDPDRARALTEDAVDCFEREGAPFEAACARSQLAACLMAAGRTEEAKLEATRARDRLRALGARLEADGAQRIVDATHGAPRGELTPRELEVLSLLAEGMTNRQIAARLVVSEHTVHRHVTNLLRKLELPSRTAAAAHALRAGMLERSGQ